MKYKGLLSALIMLVGGGDLSVNATELNTISNCSNSNQECNISTTYQNQSIQNHNSLSLKKIKIETQLLDFINYNALTLTEYITINNSGNSVKNFINYGTITTTSKYSLDTTNTATGGFMNIYNYGHISGYIYIAGGESSDTHIHNYGVMGGAIKAGNSNQTIYVNNLGTINLCENNGNCDKKAHFKNVNLVLHNYAMQINVDSATFNAFSGSASDNSHLLLDSVNSVSFADKYARLILDFGDNFEFGAKYDLNKLIVKTDGTTALNVDLLHLTARNDIYAISQRGEYFIAKLAPQYGTIGTIYKANIRTMNNFYLMSNAMIFPRKYNFVILRERSDRRISNIIDSANHLKSYETFSYRNESINRRIQRQNKRNYSRESLKTQNLESSSLRADSQNLRGNPNLDSANRDYYFILTPFINHNLFFESGRYNLSGFDYGFLTAFSARVAESNSFGAHFIMSYGNLGDSKDKDFMIKTLNLNFGLNYKLDLIWDMFLKARGDFYYFLNQAKTLTMIEAIKPNNLGFGASVSYGKEWDFKSGGVLGIEAGLDYKALQSSTISLHDNVYQKALYHLLYGDLGVSYSKYFGNFGVNAGLGIRGNITANKLAKSKIHIRTFNKSVDMVLDNDIFLGYANLGASYVLNARDFDMEFSLVYYGNFGDKAISNAGGFEWRVLW